MRKNWWGDSSNLYDNDLPQTKQCSSCHKWKNLSDFFDPLSGSSNTLCTECRLRFSNVHLGSNFDLLGKKCIQCNSLKSLGEFPAFAGQTMSTCKSCLASNASKNTLRKQCRQCFEYKEKNAFIGESDICWSCLSKSNNHTVYADIANKRWCNQCHQFKDKNDFIEGSNTCFNCSCRVQSHDIKVDLENKKWCNQCSQLKDKAAFIGNSNACISCSTSGKYPILKKQCCDCGLWKDINEFAVSTTGDSKICISCLHKYR